MVISAILKGKKKELLPPPPPFPKFGADDLDEHFGSDDSYMAKSRLVPAENEIPRCEVLARSLVECLGPHRLRDSPLLGSLADVALGRGEHLFGVAEQLLKAARMRVHLDGG